MFMTRSEYDRGVNTFSPEGRLFQVEYAIEAIKLGSTAIGIRCVDGVLLAVEKRITSKLMDIAASEKICEIETHLACACSGLMADSRTMVDRARVEAQHHWFLYDEHMSVLGVTQAVSNLAIQFGDSDSGGAMSRPFGLAMLFAGIDPGTKRPSLYFMDPSGTYVECDAKAIGSGCEGAQSALKEQYNKSLNIQAGTKEVVKILKQVMEEKISSENVEIALITKDKGYRMLTKDEIQAVLSSL